MSDPSPCTVHFPGVADDVLPLLSGMRDASWYNDARPRFELRVRAAGPDERWFTIVLWVDSPDPSLREAEGPRFTAAVEAPDGSVLSQMDSEELGAALSWLSGAALGLAGLRPRG